MDFNTLSRKELQALCKSNGIPANKTNVFMIDALAKKRVPLSQMDANRDQRIDNSIRSPFKSPTLPRTNISNVNGSGPTFANNFLRRGKRKDPPTSQEIVQEKSKLPRTNAASGLRKSSTDLSERSCTAHVRKEAGPRNTTKEVKVITSGVTSSKEFTNPSKMKIEEKVRFQIDAALCSKVMRVPEKRPSAPTWLGSSELVIDSVVTVDSSEALDLPLDYPDHQKGNYDVKVENREDIDLHPECPEQQMESSPLPDPPANQIAKREEIASTSTSLVPRSASLELIAASPPISFSPLVRQVNEKVRSIVDRVHNFWKTRELAVVNSFGSPVA